MKRKLLALMFTIIVQQIYSQCAETATNFGNNTDVPAYNVTGDVSVTLNNDDTITLDLGSNFMTAPGPDIRAYLVNSNGASDAALSTSKISSLENIPFGLVGSNTVNQNGAKSFTVAIPGSVNIEDFDKVFFYCLNFDQFWDFGSYNSFSQSSCSVLNIEDVSKTNGIRVYPNPSSNVIHLSNIGKSSGEIRIFDILGKSIYRRNKDLDRDIDVSDFKAGIYILKIDIENKSVTQKLVIR